MIDKLAEVEQRYEALSHQMADPEVATDPERVGKLAQEQSSLEEIVGLYRDYRDTERQLAESEDLMASETDEEMRQLVYQLEGTDLPYSCPHGRPTMVHMSQMQLEQEFKRR